MAALNSVSLASSIPKSLLQNPHRDLTTFLSNPKPIISPIPSLRFSHLRPPNSAPSAAAAKIDDGSTGIDALKSFIDLNLGKWNGTFYQFDPDGNLLHKVSTKLSASSYGEDELISLIQTLYIKQPPSTSGDPYEEEWAEYKIKETNLYTIDDYQQIGYFPSEKAFALRYQTAGMLETILRQGVLGEDDIGEEFPKNLMLPSRRPAIVCENCIYSMNKDLRVRAFHIMDPSGILQMLLIFIEERGGAALVPSFDNSEDNAMRLLPHLGTWKGHSITKRSGVYGATIAEAETTEVLEAVGEGQLVQVITNKAKGGDVTTNIEWTGIITNNLIKFNGGYQVTLLPGGMYMGCPSNVARNVSDSKSFHLEFCWLESRGKRQRLVRTYDVQGLAVSSTYFFETKL